MKFRAPKIAEPTIDDSSGQRFLPHAQTRGEKMRLWIAAGYFAMCVVLGIVVLMTLRNEPKPKHRERFYVANDSIYEVVIVHRLTYWANFEARNAESIKKLHPDWFATHRDSVVTVEGAPPSKELLARLRTKFPEIVFSDERRGTQNKSPKDVFVNITEWHGPQEVVVYASNGIQLIDETGQTYVLREIDGVWEAYDHYGRLIENASLHE